MSAEAVLNQSRISEVWEALGGEKLRHGRGKAFWRGGDSPNAISLSDSKNTFYDHVETHGGGVLDLIALVNGGSRQDALKWLAQFTGTALDDRPLSPEDRARYARERQQLEHDLPDARYWRLAAIALAEETLTVEKSRLFDPTEGPADLESIRGLTGMISRLEAAGDRMLVAEYGRWRDRQPGITWGMVRAARERERVAAQALCRFLGFPMRTAVEYLRGAK
jgi:hypothetical protein